MKTHIKNIKNLLLLPVLIAGINLLSAGSATAQAFATVHNFTASGDGAYPQASLVLSGNTLFGTASQGGFAEGTVFAVSADGTGFTNLHGFAGGLGAPFDLDGGVPVAALILAANTLYGTASVGGYGTGSYGTGGYGTIFKVNTNGTGYATLYNFSVPYNNSNSDGANPFAGLTPSGNTLYGTAIHGGNYSYGAVFAINPDGTGFTNLHSFSGHPDDGANPQAGLVSSGNTLYGTATHGGSSDNGAVFAVNSDGTGFSILYNFSALNNSTNGDGANPQAGLILSGNTLYGTATYGGNSGNGTVFAVKTDGTTFTNLHNFTGLNNYTNSDGAYPKAELTLAGNTLYGTAFGGGSSGNGTVFAVKTNGTGFTTLHSFTASAYDPTKYASTNSDGANPQAGLLLSGSTLYGTANGGGGSGYGTVFSLSFRPQLAITPSGIPRSGIILSWPTNVAGFDCTCYTLQSTTNLGPSAVWATNSPAPVVIGNQNVVTNPMSGPQQFYRLVH
jgi:uncharacterized repeat protein (TIGR03803 family)